MNQVIGLILGIYIVGICHAFLFFNKKEREMGSKPVPISHKLGASALWPLIFLAAVFDL